MVAHQRLLQKLQYYGLRGYLNNWVAEFLKDRQQEVVLEGTHSSATQVTSGVPMGTVLGPLLFLVFINDMPKGIDLTMQLFADNSLLYKIIRTKEDQYILQEDLHKLELWEHKADAVQCRQMRGTTNSNKRNPTICNYSVHDQHLQTVKQAKYLGATISLCLSWNQHVNFLRHNIQDCFPPLVKEQCYKIRFIPTLENVSCV